MRMAAVIRELVAAGLSGDALIAAVERIEGPAPKTSAERVQAFRARKRLENETRNDETLHRYTVTTASPEVSSLPPAPLSQLPTPSEVIPPVPPLRGKPTPKGVSLRSLPADWAPSEDEIAYGTERGLSRSQCLEAGEDMRVWAHGKGIRRADWHSTFLGFLRRDGKDSKATGPPMNGRSSLKPKTWTDAFLDEFDDRNQPFAQPRN